uniref:Uncharacterized protein n=1 Tax=Zea mays TaxID=4577 RepID=C4J778_MAIZE|nr:unknown [Zea mays]
MLRSDAPQIMSMHAYSFLRYAELYMC